MSCPDSRRAYLSLGSNIGDRPTWLGKARYALMRSPEFRLVSMSRVMETEPVDVIEQPRFLNQVLGIDTSLEPPAVLERCLEIELTLGRDRSRTEHRGPRTIDIDILLFEGRKHDGEALRIPHPRLARRPFFLELCRDAGAPSEWVPAPAPGYDVGSPA